MVDTNILYFIFNILLSFLYISSFLNYKLQDFSTACYITHRALVKCSNPDICYGNFTRKQNSDCLDMMTCDNWVFKMGKKQNSDFMETFSFSISNIFVELLVTHIKQYIYSSQRTHSAHLKNVI